MKRLGDWIAFPLLLALVWSFFVWRGFERLKTSPSKAAPAPAAGCLTAQQKKGLPHGTATRSLPVNWRLGRGDVANGPAPPAGDVFAGCPLAAGDPVVAQDLSAAPVISAAKGKVAFRLPWDGKSAGAASLNAGMQTAVFEGSGTPIVSGASVLAVTTGDSAAIYLEVTGEQAGILERSRNQLQVVQQQ